MAPKDEDELVDMMFTATHEPHRSSFAIRAARRRRAIKDQPKLLEIGKAEIVQHFTNNGGRKIALFPLGNMMTLGRKIAAQLTAEGCDVAIINPRFVKPLDAGVTEFFGRAAEVMVTFEDHVLMGGYAARCWNCSTRNASPRPSCKSLAGSVHRARYERGRSPPQAWADRREYGVPHQSVAVRGSPG